MTTAAQKRACTKALKDAMKAAGLEATNAMFVYDCSQADAHSWDNEYPSAQVDALEAAGYTVKVSAHWSFAPKVQCGYNFVVRSPAVTD